MMPPTQALRCRTVALVVVVVALVVVSASCSGAHDNNSDPFQTDRLVVRKEASVPDKSGRWISTSGFGFSYTFLSPYALWMVSIYNNSWEGVGGIILPSTVVPNLAIILGEGINTTNGHLILQFILYSQHGIANLAFMALDLATHQWIVVAQAEPPIPTDQDWQYLIPNSYYLEAVFLYFIISIDTVISVRSKDFIVADTLSLRDSFTNLYSVTNTTGAVVWKDKLFIARTGSIDNNSNKRSQIIQIDVNMDPFFPDTLGQMSFNHVTYLQTNCYNMFGWSNFLFWEQQIGTDGKLYGWDFVNRVLIYQSIQLVAGESWGTAAAVNQNNSMVVTGNPKGGGYTLRVGQLQGESFSIVDQLAVKGDRVPEIGLTTLNEAGLSVIMAGFNSTGFGKLTWYQYI